MICKEIHHDTHFKDFNLTFIKTCEQSGCCVEESEICRNGAHSNKKGKYEHYDPDRSQEREGDRIATSPVYVPIRSAVWFSPTQAQGLLLQGQVRVTKSIVVVK